MTTAGLCLALATGPALATESPAPTASPDPSPTATAPAPKPVPEPDKKTVPDAKAKLPAAKRPVAGQTATLRGRAWNDKNRNGIQEEDEPGLSGATLLFAELPEDDPAQAARIKTKIRKAGALRNPGSKPRKPGSTLAAEPTWHQADTDAQGRYELTGVRPGPLYGYVFSIVTAPNGRARFWQFSPQDATEDDAIDSDFVPESNGSEEKPEVYGALYDVVLNAGEDRTVDVGMYFDEKFGAGTVKFSGRVWNDSNRNGIQDTNEQGVPGLPVFHVVASEEDPDFVSATQRIVERVQGRTPSITDQVRIATTDAKGEYTVTGLNPGDQFLALGAGPLDDKGRITTKDWKFTAPLRGEDWSKASHFIGDHELIAFTSAGGGFFMGPGDALDIDGGVFVPTSASPTPTPNPGEGDGGGLPVTGTAVGVVIAAGAALVGGGMALTLLARRRRRPVA